MANHSYITVWPVALKIKGIKKTIFSSDSSKYIKIAKNLVVKISILGQKKFHMIMLANTQYLETTWIY